MASQSEGNENNDGNINDNDNIVPTLNGGALPFIPGQDEHFAPEVMRGCAPGLQCPHGQGEQQFDYGQLELQQQQQQHHHHHPNQYLGPVFPPFEGFYPLQHALYYPPPPMGAWFPPNGNFVNPMGPFAQQLYQVDQARMGDDALEYNPEEGGVGLPGMDPVSAWGRKGNRKHKYKKKGKKGRRQDRKEAMEEEKEEKEQGGWAQEVGVEKEKNKNTNKKKMAKVEEGENEG